ncbi:MAG: alpha/beta hydrolase fold domain-containing protein [Flavobacteriales bacterium]
MSWFKPWSETSIPWLEHAHRAARTLRRDVAHASPQQIRQAIELASRLNPGPWGGEFQRVKEDAWQGAVVTWKEHDEGTLVWIHGGAFAFGSPQVYRAAAVHLARASRCRVVLPSYRLAPEHKHPVAHDDVRCAVRHWSTQGEKMVLIGDSAGGNLALAAVAHMMAEGEGGAEAFAGVALLSPWCDLRTNAASVAVNAVAHSPFDHQDAEEYAAQYLGDHDRSSAEVSPLLGTYKGWPEMYLEYAEDEFLAPDVVELSRKLTQDEVSLTLRTEPQAVHGWQLLPDFLPESKRSISALAEWSRGQLGLPPLI